MKKQKQSQEEFERIERYLTASMKQEEQSVFEESLKTDDRLSKQVEEVRLLLQAVEEQSLRNKLDDFHKEIAPEPGVIKSIGSAQQPAFAYKKYAIAASLALLIGLGAWLILAQKSENEKLFAQHFNPDPGLITLMGTTSNYEFFRGMVDYKQGKYELAIARWNPLIDQKPKNDTLNYYLGVSYLAQGESEKAINFLSIAVHQSNSVFIHYAYYYLGLVYLKDGYSEKAINSFKQSDLENSKVILLEIDQLQ